MNHFSDRLLMTLTNKNACIIRNCAVMRKGCDTSYHCNKYATNAAYAIPLLHIPYRCYKYYTLLQVLQYERKCSTIAISSQRLSQVLGHYYKYAAIKNHSTAAKRALECSIVKALYQYYSCSTTAASTVQGGDKLSCVSLCAKLCNSLFY